jgi:hypothetical protein
MKRFSFSGLESMCDGDRTIGEEVLIFNCHDLWRSNVMVEELYSAQHQILHEYE